MVLFQDFYHPPHIVVYQYIIILFSPEWCLIRSSQEDLPGELFIFHFPFIYYSPVPVSLGYIAGLTKALPVATVPEIPAYRKRYYMVRYFRFHLEVEYKSVLGLRFSIRGPLPWGLGFHPYNLSRLPVLYGITFWGFAFGRVSEHKTVNQH